MLDINRRDVTTISNVKTTNTIHGKENVTCAASGQPLGEGQKVMRILIPASAAVVGSKEITYTVGSEYAKSMRDYIDYLRFFDVMQTAVRRRIAEKKTDTTDTARHAAVVKGLMTDREFIGALWRRFNAMRDVVRTTTRDLAAC